MTRILKFECWRLKSRSDFAETGPIDLAVVFEALKQGFDFIDLVMAEKRVFADSQFVALPGHNVDLIMQDPLDQEIAQFAH